MGVAYDEGPVCVPIYLFLGSAQLESLRCCFILIYCLVVIFYILCLNVCEFEFLPNEY